MDIKIYHFLYLRAVEENKRLWLEVVISRNQKYGQSVKYTDCQTANEAYERLETEIQRLLYDGYTVSEAFEILYKEKFLKIVKEERVKKK